MASTWIITPSDADLFYPSGWEKLPKKIRAALRYYLLIEKEVSDREVNGRVVSSQKRIPGDKFIQSNKIERIVSKTSEIEETVVTTFSEQMTSDVISKIGGSLSLKDITAALSGEVQKKISKTLTHSIQQSLKNKESFSWSEKLEQTNSLEQTTPGSIQQEIPYRVHYLLKEHTWKIYLMRTEYLSLKYQGYDINWFDKRFVHKPDNDDIKKPLYRIKFYEPYPEFSYTTQPYKVEVQDEKEIIIKAFLGPVPEKRIPPAESLTELALIAFPIGRDERKAAKKKLRPSPASISGRFTGSKKKAMKKAAPKKAAKKAAPKKAAKKAAPKKKAAKKK